MNVASMSRTLFFYYLFAPLIVRAFGSIEKKELLADSSPDVKKGIVLCVSLGARTHKK